MTEIFNLVEVGSVVWFPPMSVTRRHPRPGVAYRPVEDLGPTTIMLAWPRESRSPAVAAFVRVATEVASEAESVDAVVLDSPLAGPVVAGRGARAVLKSLT